MSNILKNKKIIISAGASGIGWSTAKVCLSKGATVFISDIEKKFLNKLKQFGLNSYEAKIWTALLSRGVSTAGELSDISNVPRSRSYDVLESLEKKGFIIMKLL